MEAPEASPAGPPPAGFDGPRACDPYELAPTLDLINLVFRTQRVAGATLCGPVL